MEILEQGQYGEYLAFLEEQGAHFMQTPFWAGVKPAGATIFWCCGKRGKSAPGFCCYAVKFLEHTFACSMRRGAGLPGKPLGGVFGEIIQYARKRRAYCLKIDPYVSAENAEYGARLCGMGFLQLPAGEMGNTQPKFVYQVDIAGKDPAQILQGFTPKARYNTRVAERRGVRVTQGEASGPASFTGCL